MEEVTSAKAPKMIYAHFKIERSEDEKARIADDQYYFGLCTDTRTEQEKEYERGLSSASSQATSKMRLELEDVEKLQDEFKVELENVESVRSVLESFEKD